MKLPYLIALVATLTGTLFLSACNTTEGTSVDTDAVTDIARGSPVADLISLWGEPESIAPLEKDPNVSVWTYRFEKSRTDLVGFETEEIPYVDPITGAERTITEPIMKPSTQKSVQIVEVFIVENQVLGWKAQNDQKQVNSLN